MVWASPSQARSAVGPSGHWQPKIVHMEVSIPLQYRALLLYPAQFQGIFNCSIGQEGPKNSLKQNLCALCTRSWKRGECVDKQRDGNLQEAIVLSQTKNLPSRNLFTTLFLNQTSLSSSQSHEVETGTWDSHSTGTIQQAKKSKLV